MNIADILVIIVIALIFGAAVACIIKNAKSGRHCSGCGGACGGCTYADTKKRKSK